MLPEGHAYVNGFNVGRPGQKCWWRIPGYKKQFDKAEQALVFLKQLYGIQS
jgi:hypothetical protein